MVMVYDTLFGRVFSTFQSPGYTIIDYLPIKMLASLFGISAIDFVLCLVVSWAFILPLSATYRERKQNNFKAAWMSIILIIVFSNCDTSLPLGFEPGTLIKECRESLSTYGFIETDIEFFDFPVRNFDKFRQEILEKLILVYRSQTFDTVFFPGSTDTHQDHSVLSQEAIRACKKSTMLGYEMSWNSFGSKKNFFVEILDEDLTKKVKSIKKYGPACFQARTKVIPFIESLSWLHGFK
jgi:hypothetical protein